MKFSCALVLIAGIGSGLVASAPDAAAQDTPAKAPSAEHATALPAAHDLTPAQQRIAAAKQQIQANLKSPQPYNELALAWIRRVRETADPAYYHDAEQAIAAGFLLAPDDFQLKKTYVALLLGEHEFAKARTEATALNHHTPDDVTIYGYLAEADIALGDYPDAEKSAQWMLNLLPNNVPGLLLGAELRDLYGDPEGALELLNRAYTETSPAETEELAWIANRIAEVQIGSGKLEEASQVLQATEQLFPRYPCTLQNLARVRQGQGRPAEAIALLRKEQEIAPGAQVLYRLAKAEELAGETSAAVVTYANFEKIAKAQIEQPANANRDLIFYYANHAKNAAQALSVAQREIALRHDVWTLDANAWALYTNGRYAEANAQIERALAAGIHSAQIFDHAGDIALKLKNQAQAVRYFEVSLQADPSSEYAPDARKTLNALAIAAPADPPATSAPTATNAAPPQTAPRNQIESPIPTKAPTLEAPPAEQQPMASDVKGASTNGVGFRPVPAALLTPRPTGTARVIRTMQARVARNPREAQAYAGLGAAFFQRARETGDVEDYQLAEQALTKSLDLVSADMSATTPLATMAEVCMGEHRFADALSYAQRALSLGSGDLSPFAIVGDAYADMGEYEKAAVAYARLQSPDGEAASQPRSTYVRVSRTSYLKFISGDTAGAIQLMQTAVAAGVEARLPRENLAWLYFELGEYYFQDGNAQAANDAYLAALTIHPGDYRALAALGKVRANQGRYPEAITLYQSAIAVVPMPIYIAELGDLYTKTGNTTEAKKQYQLVEYIGLLGHINQVLHNRDLALFYADHDRKLGESLVLARKEFEVRHDVYTWDALAWALYKNGKYAEASDAMEHARRLGTKDSLILFHAGMISARLGQDKRAAQEFDQALTVNPHFHIIYAGVARQQLAFLQKQLALAAKGKNEHVQ
ncbi:MAG: tetratricopeptide repeat protein [Acidobacteriaceae bacterium]